jgi:MFS family permease
MATRLLNANRIRPASSSAVLVALLAAAIFLSYIDRGLLAIAGPLITQELGLSATQFGLAVSAFFWVYAPAQLLCGWMVDRYSVYRLFAAGVALWAAATLMLGLVGGLLTLVLLRLLMGLGQSFCFPGSSKMIARHCGAEQRGFANGIVMAGLAAGQATGALVGGLIMAAFGWRPMCVFFGLITLLWLLPWQRLTFAAGSEERAEAKRHIPHREILGKRALWGSCAGHFCNNYGFYFLLTWMPLYLVNVRGLTIAMMATLTALTFAIQTIVALASGWASDRLVVGGLPEGPVRKALNVGANIVKAGAIFGIAFAQSQTAVIACLAVTGFTIGITSAQNFAIPQIFAGPLAAGRWVGMQNFVANLAGITGPIITGLIIDATNSYTDTFLLAGAITLLGAFFWGVVVPRVEPVRWRAVAKPLSA